MIWVGLDQALGEWLIGEEQDTFGIGINYKLAKGVRLNGFAAYVDYTGTVIGDEGGATYKDTWTGWVIGTGIGLSW